MESEIKITFEKMHLRSIAITTPSSSSVNVGNHGRGCPCKSYEDCSSKTKKRRLRDLRSKYSQEQLCAAVAPNNKICCKYSLPNDEQDGETFINKVLAMYMIYQEENMKCFELIINAYSEINFILLMRKFRLPKKMLSSKYNCN